MKILVACEYSGIVRDAFTALGHDATSCDYLPTESPGKHITGDVSATLSENWDMVLAFPNCKWLTSAASWRWKDTEKELLMSRAFVEKIWNCNAKYICIENPTGWLNNNWRQPDQILSPHFFGSRFCKRTCFWLKNLPPLIYGCQVLNPRAQVKQFGSKHNKSKLRSKFSPQLAEAMATQWNYQN